MKKFLLFALFTLLFFQKVAGQEKSPKNSLSVVVAPNVFFQIPGTLYSDVDYDPGFGYTVGVDVMHELSKSWHCKLGLRYNNWHSTTQTGPLMWASEYSTGQYVYDPTLPHYTTIKHSDKAWQILGSAGWHSKPKKWRWNTDIEVGVTHFTKKTTGGQNVTRLTTGFNFGPEWMLNRRFHLYVQPGGRFIFNEIRKGEYAGHRFFAMQVETGVRYAF